MTRSATALLALVSAATLLAQGGPDWQALEAESLQHDQTLIQFDTSATEETAAEAVYGVPTVPSMSTYATDMIGLRQRGVQCIGIGAAVDIEDQSKGFGMRSDQERLLESELHRFVRFNWELVTALARAR